MSKLTVAFLLVAAMAFMISESEACFGLLGGSGGCCGAPPPSCGSCGKRKKRDVLEQQIKTKESNPCPQSEWKKIMDAAITADPVSSVYAIQGKLHDTFGVKFFVTCVKVIEGQEGSPAAFVTNGEGYCSHGNSKTWCEAIALYG